LAARTAATAEPAAAVASFAAAALSGNTARAAAAAANERSGTRGYGSQLACCLLFIARFSPRPLRSTRRVWLACVIMLAPMGLRGSFAKGPPSGFATTWFVSAELLRHAHELQL
jgi:hypothetical protein